MTINHLVLDIENDNTNRYKRTAGNFLYDKIVAIGLKESNTDAVSRTDIFNTLGWRLASPPGIRILVGHNIKHDLLFLWKAEFLQMWIRNGGKIWDTQLAEYYLTSFENKYPALRDIAVNKYGCEDREKHIDKWLFNRPDYMKDLMIRINKFGDFPNEDCDKLCKLYKQLRNCTYEQVSDLPEELVLEDVRNDVLDTESIYLQQLEKAKQLGILEVLEIQMEYLLATTEMEFNGFFVDLETLQKNRAESIEKLIPIKTEFETLVNKYIPLELFNAQPKKGLHALFFGGEIKTVEKKQALDQNGLPLMIKTGQKSGQLKYKNETKIIKIKGLELKAQDNWKTEKGNISIDEGVLKEIINIIGGCQSLQQNQTDARNICKNLLDIRNIEKQISTYYDAIEELVYDIDQCVHGKIHHVSTGTGRTSSSDPNQQNIPQKRGSHVKEQFKTRF